MISYIIMIYGIYIYIYVHIRSDYIDMYIYTHITLIYIIHIQQVVFRALVGPGTCFKGLRAGVSTSDEVRGEEASNGHGQPLPGAVRTEPAGPENWI